MKSKPNYIIIENERAAANLSLLCLVLELNHVGLFSTAPPSDAISFAFWGRYKEKVEFNVALLRENYWVKFQFNGPGGQFNIIIAAQQSRRYYISLRHNKKLIKKDSETVMKLGFQLEDSWWVGVLCTIKVLLMFLTL